MLYSEKMAPAPIPGEKLSRSDSIQALRGMASVAVAWFHLTGQYHSFAKSTGSLGWLGVEVFFVISGFVIPLSIWNSREPYSVVRFPTFMARRVVRIEPPYLISAVMVVILWEISARAPGFAGSPYEFNVFQILSHIAYIIPLTKYDWLQPVYWTLAFEFVFYIFVGLGFPLISGGKVAWALVNAVLLTAVILGLSPIWILFAMGIAAFRAMTGVDHAFFSMAIVAALGAIMAYRGAELEAIAGLCAAILIYSFYNISLSSRIGRMLIWLGSISFSLYLIHVPIGGRIVNLGRRFITSAWASELGLSFAALAISLIAATIFHRLVESPSIRASRQLDRFLLPSLGGKRLTSS